MSDRNIWIVGDLCISGEPETRILGTTQYNLWEGLETFLNTDDILIANFESALTDHDKPAPFKWATLRANPDCLKSLNRLDVAILANNHVSDFGEVGALDTINNLQKAGVKTVGLGNNLEDAIKPELIEIFGEKFAIIAYSCPTTNGENMATHVSPGAAPISIEYLKKGITKASSISDALLVYLHWGVEQSHYPVPDQIRLARFAIDCGADAVIGCHAHVIQCYENYKGKWIFYGLGNFLFGPVDTFQILPDGSNKRRRHEQALPNRQSLVLKFHLCKDNTDNPLQLELVQPVECNNDYVPYPISIKALTVDLEDINNRLSQYTWNNQEHLKSYKEPIFKSYIRNGIMAYFYNTAPINLLDTRSTQRFDEFGNSSLRRLLQKSVKRIRKQIHL